MINRFDKAIINMADGIIKNANFFSSYELDIIKYASQVLKDEESEKQIQESLCSCRRIIDGFLGD